MEWVDYRLFKPAEIQQEVDRITYSRNLSICALIASMIGIFVGPFFVTTILTKAVLSVMFVLVIAANMITLRTILTFLKREKLNLSNSLQIVRRVITSSDPDEDMPKFSEWAYKNEAQILIAYDNNDNLHMSFNSDEDYIAFKMKFI